MWVEGEYIRASEVGDFPTDPDCWPPAWNAGWPSPDSEELIDKKSKRGRVNREALCRAVSATPSPPPSPPARRPHRRELTNGLPETRAADTLRSPSAATTTQLSPHRSRSVIDSLLLRGGVEPNPGPLGNTEAMVAGPNPQWLSAHLNNLAPGAYFTVDCVVTGPNISKSRKVNYAFKVLGKRENTDQWETINMSIGNNKHTVPDEATLYSNFVAHANLPVVEHPSPILPNIILRKLARMEVGTIFRLGVNPHAAGFETVDMMVASKTPTATGSIPCCLCDGSLRNIPDPRDTYVLLQELGLWTETATTSATPNPRRESHASPATHADQATCAPSNDADGAHDNTNGTSYVSQDATAEVESDNVVTPHEDQEADDVSRELDGPSNNAIETLRTDDSDNARAQLKRPPRQAPTPPTAVSPSPPLSPPVPNSGPKLPPPIRAPVQMPALPRPSPPATFAPPPLNADAQATTRSWPVATEPADVCDFRCSVPRVAFLLPAQRKDWAAAIGNIICGYRSKTEEERNAVLEVLLLCPSKLLPRTKDRAGSRSIPLLSAQALREMQLETDEAAPRSSDPEKRQLNRAQSFAVQGFLGRAVATLMRPAPDTKRDENALLAALRALHPKRVEVVEPCTEAFPVELTLPPPAKKRQTEPRLKSIIRRYCKGKNPGPSGWTEELIRDAITSETEADWLELFSDIASAALSSSSLRHLRRASLLGIPKKPSGARPIAMGETFVKVAARLLLLTDRNLVGRQAVGDSQFAFESCGAEQIIHKVRHLLRADGAIHAVLVDCRNAFNCIRRQAIREQLMANPALGPLRSLFNAMYVEQSELLVQSDEGECPVICGTEGVRQGDVLGPLLFCIGLKPAIDRTLELMQIKHPEMSVSLFAYMDDVTIVGTSEACLAAFEILQHELQEGLSLMVNTDKTVTTCQRVATKIGCELSACPKLLGAYVGRSCADEKAHLDTLPASHDCLFDRLPRLPAEIAFRLLACCGVPKWAHLVRTHEPESVREASFEFTGLAVRCYASILGIDYNALTGEDLRQITLPERLGGMGITDWAEVADLAYRASLQSRWASYTSGAPAEANEEGDTAAPPDAGTGGERATADPDEDLGKDLLWEKAVEEVKASHPQLYTRLANGKSAMARAWLHSPLTVSSVHTSKLFRCAMLVRMAWAGAQPDEPTHFRCKCGYPRVNAANCTSRDVMSHVLGCANSGGVTRRHHMIRDALAGLLKRGGYTVACEVPVTTTEDPLRMDIVCHPHDGGSAIMIDTTILNSAAKRFESKDVTTELQRKHKEKEDKYGAAARSMGADLLPFALDVFGSLPQSCRSFLTTLVSRMQFSCEDADEKATIALNATIIPALSRALAFGNGTCLLMSNKLREIGVPIGIGSRQQQHHRPQRAIRATDAPSNTGPEDGLGVAAPNIG